MEQWEQVTPPEHAYTTRERLNALAAWLRGAVNDLRLKRPDDRNVETVEYVAPRVHAAYLPPVNGRNPNMMDAPSVTVSPSEIVESNGTGTLTARAVALTWDAGTRPIAAQGGTPPATNASAEGWESAMLILDTIATAVHACADVSGMRVEPGVKLGFYTDGNHDPLDARPYYMGWIEFDVTYAYAAPARSFDRFLD